MQSLKLAFHDADTDTDILARIFGRVGEDPHEEVGVGVGVVECGLMKAAMHGAVLHHAVPCRIRCERISSR